MADFVVNFSDGVSYSKNNISCLEHFYVIQLINFRQTCKQTDRQILIREKKKSLLFYLHSAEQ